MVNSTLRRLKCETCDIKIPKAHPKLFCSICSKVKHLACQKLTKADAKLLIDLNISWTCNACIFDILPVNACSLPKRDKNSSSTDKFKVKCAACSGFSYSIRSVRICDFCDQHVHVKCWNNSLGCNKCCEAIIPGFHAFSYELLGDPYLKNDKVYNPYSSTHLTQMIGEILENEESSNNAFSDVAEILINCRYKQPSIVTTPNELELSILSLNIRTLQNKIENMRENIEFYEKFDALLFNETNCIKSKLPNGVSDLSLAGFLDPIIQDPIRSTGKGGGLAIYINKRICSDEENIQSFIPYEEPENTCGEFQFVKIKGCKGHPKSVILGNVYRSPSNKPDKFNKLYDIILQKLNTNRYANKIKFIAGDFNQDLIKHDDDIECQNLIDAAHNHGFAQIVARPTRITEHSATLIDHVYTSNIENTLSCNILTLDLSDHLATHTKLSFGSNTQQPRHTNPVLKNGNTSDFRLFNAANNQNFENLMKHETWTDISTDMDTQTAYNKFEEIYMKHYNTAFPLKANRTRRENERQNPKPWILPWLEDACARRQNAYHEFVKRPSSENKKNMIG